MVRLLRLAATLFACVAGCAACGLPSESVGGTTSGAPEASVSSTTPPATLSASTFDPAASCPDDRPGDWTAGLSGTDYGDFVQLRGRMYFWESATPRVAAELGDVVGRVCFTLSEMSFSGTAPIQDGDASILPIGTELRGLLGGDADLRVAAVTGDGVLVYEVTVVEGATVGADLIDLTGSVLAIGINSGLDNSPLAAIDNPDTVATLIAALAAAPVDLSSSAADSPSYSIELRRADGTTTTRPYSIDSGILGPGVSLPDTWRDAINAAAPPGSTSPPPTTAPPVEPVEPVSTDAPPALSDATMQNLAAALGLDGPIEPRRRTRRRPMHRPARTPRRVHQRAHLGWLDVLGPRRPERSRRDRRTSRPDRDRLLRPGRRRPRRHHLDRTQRPTPTGPVHQPRTRHGRRRPTHRDAHRADRPTAHPLNQPRHRDTVTDRGRPRSGRNDRPGGW